MPSQLQKRVLNHELWFDRIRAEAKAFYKGASFAKILELTEKTVRYAVFTDILQMASKAQAGGGRTLKSLMDEAKKGNPEVFFKKVNDTLPVKLPDGPFVEAVYTMPEAYREDLPEVEGLLVATYIDHATTHLSVNLLISPTTELSVMEGDLATRVLKSNNPQPITGEDLQHTPFSQMLLEFSSPVRLIETQYGVINARAVGFYKNEQVSCYAMTWYSDQRSGHFGWINRMCSILVTPNGRMRLSIDEDSRKELNIRIPTGQEVGPERYESKIFKDYKERMQEVQIQMESKSRNIWDFVTSRNIDYERQERTTHNWAIVRRYRHLQGKMEFGPRTYRILRVNKAIHPKEGESGPLIQDGIRQHVPGCFHKFVYCRQCSKLHRHDLIGSPCRRCEVQVGPFSNIEIKKYWHTDYWRGPTDGLLKQVVRDIQT